MILIGVTEKDDEVLNRAFNILKKEFLDAIISHGKYHLELDYKEIADSIIDNSLTMLACPDHEKLINTFKEELYQYIKEIKQCDWDSLVVLNDL